MIKFSFCYQLIGHHTIEVYNNNIYLFSFCYYLFGHHTIELYVFICFQFTTSLATIPLSIFIYFILLLPQWPPYHWAIYLFVFLFVTTSLATIPLSYIYISIYFYLSGHHTIELYIHIFTGNIYIAMLWVQSLLSCLDYNINVTPYYLLCLFLTVSS